MQSLSLSMSLRSGSLANFLLLNSETKVRRRSFTVACASEGESGSGTSSFLSRTQTYALLKQQLQVAAKSEDYKEAARIRDSLKLFEDEEPVLRLRRLLKEAIAQERFQDAASYRDELKKIAPHSLLKCSSDATTLEIGCFEHKEVQTHEDLQCYNQGRVSQFFVIRYQVSINLQKCSNSLFFSGRNHSASTLGIRVQVRSVYIEGRSQPSQGLYFFAYRIRITNNSEQPVQLLRRHWIITDANGKMENVWGIGVVGEQPLILPGNSFEYSSACPLSTQNGRMEGDFEMIHVDRVGSRSFNVAIAPFSLSLLGDDDACIM